VARDEGSPEAASDSAGTAGWGAGDAGWGVPLGADDDGGTDVGSATAVEREQPAQEPEVESGQPSQEVEPERESGQPSQARALEPEPEQEPALEAAPEQALEPEPARPASQPRTAEPAAEPGSGEVQPESDRSAWGGRPEPDAAAWQGEPLDSDARAEPEPATAPAPDGPVQEAGWAAPRTAAAAPAHDPNLEAIRRAGLNRDATGWLEQVAMQVEPRLDRINPAWREQPQHDAARACAFGLLLGHLGAIYPHMEGDIGRVAEAHPSFSTLLEGSRLATLQQIAQDPGRATAWLGPLIDVDDRERVRRLLE
jgi:hypothetical protein